MERVEKELYMLRDVAEGEEVAEMRRLRRRSHEIRGQVMAYNVPEELEKGPWRQRLHFDLMKEALRIVVGSSIVLWDLKMVADSLIALPGTRTFSDSLAVLKDLNGFGDSLDVWRNYEMAIAKGLTAWMV